MYSFLDGFRNVKSIDFVTIGSFDNSSNRLLYLKLVGCILFVFIFYITYVRFKLTYVIWLLFFKK